MNENKIIKLFIVLYIIYAGGITFANNNYVNLLKKAFEYTSNTMFKTSNPNYDGISYDGKNAPEILILSGKGNLRSEVLIEQVQRKRVTLIPNPKEKKEYVWIEDENGAPLENIAIERQYPTDVSWLPIVWGMLDNKRKINFQIRNTTYNGIPCYVIVCIFSHDYESILNASPFHFRWKTITSLFPDRRIMYRNFSEDEFNKNIEKLEKNYFKVIELIIDKNHNRPFIYGYKAFDINGAEISSGNWGNLVFLNNLDSKLFSLPPETKVIPVNNHAEYSQVYINNFTAGNIPEVSWFDVLIKKISDLFAIVWLWLLSNGNWFFGIIGGIALLIIIVLKLKKR